MFQLRDNYGRSNCMNSKTLMGPTCVIFYYKNSDRTHDINALQRRYFLLSKPEMELYIAKKSNNIFKIIIASF